MVDSVTRLAEHIDAVDKRLGIRIDEIGGKLDALIDFADRSSREYHDRLNRLEKNGLTEKIQWLNW